jgi:hypothetical protein
MEIAVPMEDVVGRMQKRWLASFAETVEEWSACVSALSRWEDEHLLDGSTPAFLADHKATIGRLLGFGRSLSLVTENPDFFEGDIRDMVAATQLVLQDKLRMWHGPRLAQADSDRILAACFPDEP